MCTAALAALGTLATELTPADSCCPVPPHAVLDAAARSGHVDLVAWLCDHCTDPQLHTAAGNGAGARGSAGRASNGNGTSNGTGHSNGNDNGRATSSDCQSDTDGCVAPVAVPAVPAAGPGVGSSAGVEALVGSRLLEAAAASGSTALLRHLLCVRRCPGSVAAFRAAAAVGCEEQLELMAEAGCPMGVSCGPGLRDGAGQGSACRAWGQVGA